MKRLTYVAAIDVETTSAEAGARRAADLLTSLCRGGNEFGLTLHVFDPTRGTGLKIERRLGLAKKINLAKRTDKGRREADELDRCRAIAELAHHGQTRRGGLPYVTHPEAVAEACKSNQAKCVAWLHDSVEDNPFITPALLLRFGVSPRVVKAVRALTKHPGERYEAYLERVASDPLALVVKIKDIRHNLRSAPKPEKVEVYKAALRFLESKNKCNKRNKKSKPKA